MKSSLLERELLDKPGVFWYQLAAEIDAFKMNLVTTTYGDVAMEE